MAALPLSFFSLYFLLFKELFCIIKRMNEYVKFWKLSKDFECFSFVLLRLHYKMS